MRDFDLIVPRDCVASNDPAENDHALNQMARVLKADITPSVELDLGRLAGGARSGYAARASGGNHQI